ncbi:MAG: hypothetical protein JNM84_17250 [Planctomycetes bacterium]|nr:hypothetical protein [Planctomycetota bacterium]
MNFTETNPNGCFTFGTGWRYSHEIEYEIEWVHDVPVLATGSVRLQGASSLFSAAPGAFLPQLDPVMGGRLFVDTGADGRINSTPDSQRCEFVAEISLDGGDPSDLAIQWELREADDEVNSSGPESSLAWFAPGNHSFVPGSLPVNFPSTRRGSIIGLASTEVAPTGGVGEYRSSIQLAYGDDGGDNYVLGAQLYRKSDGRRLSVSQTAPMTVWRKRSVHVYSMAAPASGIGFKPSLGSKMAAAFQAAFVDLEVSWVGELPHMAVLPISALGPYMHAAPSVNDALPATYTLLGVDSIASWNCVRDGMLRTCYTAGNSLHAPHSMIAVGDLRRFLAQGRDLEEEVELVGIHELGHLMIGYLGEAENHKNHGVVQGRPCALRVDSKYPHFCDHHRNVLRDRVARGFSAPYHNQAFSILDSPQTR